jgi:hypothetical protein
MVALGLLGIGAGLALSRSVWETYSKEDVKRSRAVQAKKKAEAELDRLAQQDDKLRSPAGREEWLRHNQYRFQNEVPLR